MPFNTLSCRSGVRCAAVVALAGLAPAASAQSFNIDFGAGAPSAAFGGPAGQAGAWNAIPGELTTYPLVDTAGNATGVTIQSDLLSGLPATNPRPETAGDPDLAAFLDDSFFLYGDVLGEFAVFGLQPGEYDLVITGILVGEPDQPTTLTWLSDDFSEFQDDVTGDAPYTGVWERSVTHASFRVPVGPSGELRFIGTGVFTMETESFGNINGVQIVRVPGPSAAAGLGAACGLLALRRRRR